MEVSASEVGPQEAGRPGPWPIGPVADHKLLRMIGQGSYGQVWLAQNVMGAYRAVKIVHRRRFEEDRPFEREYQGIRQFEPISRSHEGFIDLMHIGRNEEEGYFYYIMELGDDRHGGSPIDPARYAPRSLATEHRPAGRLPLAECLRVALVLSDALGHLHERGLIHRDIKPSNILFVEGVPKLADIGLVAPLGQAPSYVGTEGYIPPEGPGTVKADLYSLGKVLYEISTGKDRQEFPELPADFAEFDPGFIEFNEILLKACQNDPEKRYGSAREMHNELTILKNGQSIKRLRFLERRLAQIKRGAAAAVVLGGIAGLISYPIYQEGQQAKERRNHQIGYKVALGAQALHQGDLQGALRPLVQALIMNEDPQKERTHRLRCSAVLEQCPKIVQFWTRTNLIRSVQFSPDGRYLVAGMDRSGVTVFDAWQGQVLISRLGDFTNSFMAAFNLQGDKIALLNSVGKVSVWSFPESRRLSSMTRSDEMYSVRFDPTGDRLVTSGHDGSAQIWRVSNGELIGTTQPHQGRLDYATFSPDGDYLITCSRDQTVQLWKADTLRPHRSPLHHPMWPFYAAFSPDGKRVVTACMDRKLRIWDVETGKLILDSLTHEDAVRATEYSPDGNSIWTASLDGTIRLWDAQTLQAAKRNSILRHSDRVMTVSIAGDSHRVATGCTDGSIRIWELAAGQEHMVAATNSYDLAGRRYLRGSSNRIEVYDAVTEKPVASALVFTSRVIQAQLNSPGSLLLVGLRESTNRSAWQALEVLSGRPVTRKISSPLTAPRTCLSEDGRYLILSEGREAQVWNLQSARETARITGKTPIDKVLFNQDARQWLILRGPTAEIRYTENGQLAFAPIAMRGKIRHGEYSPDNRTFVLGYANDSLESCYAQVFDANRGIPVGKPLRHRDGILHVTYSPDGKQVATSSEDFSALVWDLATSQPVGPSFRHQHQVYQSSFSPDGRWLATISADETARVWDIASGEPVTPLIYFTQPMGQGRFVASGKKILGVAEPVMCSVWSLPEDSRPLQDWIKMAQVLSGSSLIEGINQGMIGALRTDWMELKARYPSDFSATRQEMAYWHEIQALSCRRNERWPAAFFHLNRLLEFRPGNEKALAQRQTVLECLKKTEFAPNP